MRIVQGDQVSVHLTITVHHQVQRDFLIILYIAYWDLTPCNAATWHWQFRAEHVPLIFKVKGIPRTLKMEVCIGLLVIFILFLSEIE